jgi:2-polyprenyl-3-methyl-5-hydroxy-6-metoxy-1,4-benzoquinol methylase
MEPNFFEARSPFFDHPLLTAARTDSELDFILSELQLSAGARLLDVGCGFGRHSLALAHRGFAVTGIDPSSAMIHAARERASAAGVQIDYRQLRGEELVTDENFDAAICLFSTLGQITSAGENSSLISSVFAALKPGGHFVVEVPQRETATRELIPTEDIGGGDSNTHIVRKFNPADNTLSEIFTRQTPEGKQDFLLRYRLFSQAELATQLEEIGFIIQAVYGGYELAPLAANSAVMVFFAVKPQ